MPCYLRRRQGFKQILLLSKQKVYFCKGNENTLGYKDKRQIGNDLLNLS